MPGIGELRPLPFAHGRQLLHTFLSLAFLEQQRLFLLTGMEGQG